MCIRDSSYAVDGKTKKVSTTRNIWTETLLDKAASSASLELKNTGKSTLFARLVAEGIPAEGKEEAYANGLTLAVSYMDHDGPVSYTHLDVYKRQSPFSSARNYHLVKNKNNNVHKNAYIRRQSVCRKCNC